MRRVHAAIRDTEPSGSVLLYSPDFDGARRVQMDVDIFVTRRRWELICTHQTAYVPLRLLDWEESANVGCKRTR